MSIFLKIFEPNPASAAYKKGGGRLTASPRTVLNTTHRTPVALVVVVLVHVVVVVVHVPVVSVAAVVLLRRPPVAVVAGIVEAVGVAVAAGQGRNIRAILH